MSGQPPTLQPVVGAGLLGILLAAPLFGIYSLQVYYYYIKYPQDRLWTKAPVYFLWVLMAAQYAVNIHGIYAYLILDFGHPERLGIADGDFMAYLAFDSIAAIVVQGFFARRIYLIIKNPVLKWISVVLIVSFSLLGLIFGLYLYDVGFRLVHFSNFHTATWLADLWLGANVACDTIITLCMCLTLHKSRTGVKRTDLLINKLMAYSIQTGAMTSFVELFCLITATTKGFHFGHILVIFPLAGLYCTSFLNNLHARTPNAPASSDNGLISLPSGASNTFGTSVNGSSVQKMRFNVPPSSSQLSAAEYEMSSEFQKSKGYDDMKMNGSRV